MTKLNIYQIMIICKKVKDFIDKFKLNLIFTIKVTS